MKRQIEYLVNEKFAMTLEELDSQLNDEEASLSSRATVTLETKLDMYKGFLAEVPYPFNVSHYQQ